MKGRCLSGFYNKNSGIKIELIWAVEKKNLLKITKIKRVIIQLGKQKNSKKLKNV